MIQISILSGTSPASRKAAPPWGEHCKVCVHAAGTSSGCLPLCTALCGGSDADSKQAIARLYPVGPQSFDPTHLSAASLTPNLTLSTAAPT